MHIGGCKIEVTRKRIKHLYLRMKEPGCVEVSAPKHWPGGYIQSVLEARSDWIKEQQQKLLQRQLATPKFQSYEDHAEVFFEGQSYRLNAVLKSAFPHLGAVTLCQKNKTLTLSLSDPSNLDARKKQLDKWLRAELKGRITQLLEQWQPIMEVAASDFGVRKMKTRWGSCNIRTHKIWLNFDLIAKAPESLEYVVVHELTHLYERYHNKRFYSLMAHYLPDWRERKQRLNS